MNLPLGTSPNPERTYDELAKDWESYTKDNFFNAHWERPAVLKHIPSDMGDKKAFDAGCGTGFYTDRMLRRGATVHAVDISQNMVNICKKEHKKIAGRKLKVERKDLDEPLDYLGDDSFDLVLASLVIHYVADLRQLFKEFYRILRPSGLLIFSTNHPFWNFTPRFSPSEYFCTELVVSRWKITPEHRVDMTYYRRPLTGILEPLKGAGFFLEELDEPRPDDVSNKGDLQPFYKEYAVNPVFLVIKAVKKGPATTRPNDGARRTRR